MIYDWLLKTKIGQALTYYGIVLIFSITIDQARLVIYNQQPLEHIQENLTQHFLQLLISVYQIPLQYIPCYSTSVNKLLS